MSVQLNGLGANLLYAGLSPYSDGVERRSTPRIELPFPATVRGIDRSGERFELATLLDNLSATGLYLRLARPVEPGATLFVVVRFAVAPAAVLAAPGVAARGVVVWVEPQPGAWGVAMKFTRQRFLYAAAN